MEATMDTEHVDVAYVAHLARLQLSGDEVRHLQGQLDDIVAYVHKIRELDLSGVEPTAHAVTVHNVFRDDKVREGLPMEVALANAPARVNDQFKVPQIVE